MSARGTYRSSRHQRLVPAYLAAVILGIIGMHALMQHCPTPAHATTAGAGVAELSHHLESALGTTIPAPHTGVGSVEANGQPGRSLGDVLMLCAAMLLGAGALRMLLHGRLSGRPLGLTRLRPTRWRPSVPVSATGPPSTLAFTVIRC